MKGLERKIDDLGRLCLPKEMREACGIEFNEPVEMELVNGGILIRPATARCVICGGSDRLVWVNNTAICDHCIMQAEIMKTVENKGKAAL